MQNYSRDVLIFFRATRKLPLMADIPPTSPPTAPVININKNELLPIPRSSPILADKMLSLAVSIQNASPHQSNNKPKNAERKANPAL